MTPQITRTQAVIHAREDRSELRTINNRLTFLRVALPLANGEQETMLAEWIAELCEQRTRIVSNIDHRHADTLPNDQLMNVVDPVQPDTDRVIDTDFSNVADIDPAIAAIENATTPEQWGDAVKHVESRLAS